MMDKQVRGKYTLEFKLEAVRQVKAGRFSVPSSAPKPRQAPRVLLKGL